MSGKPQLKRWFHQVGVFVLLLFLAGCIARPDVAQPRGGQTAGEVWGEQTVGQTFVAERNGLNRIDVLLATYARRNAGPVIFHLRESPTATQDLAVLQFDAADVQDNAYRTFTFPALRDSGNRSYYFFLEAPAAEPGNAITAWASPSDTYRQGRFYLGGQPQPGDLAFRTYTEYSPAQIGRDLWQGLRRHAGTALLAVLLFLAPGYAVLSLLSESREAQDSGLHGRDPVSTVVLAAGLSVALTPLLILYTSLAGLTLNRGFIIALLALSTILAALSTRPTLYAIRNTQYALRSTQYALRSALPPFLLLFIFLLSLAARLLLVQDLVAPMWGDSYHHTLIAQLLVDHGGLFRSWEPYVPLQSFTYHFGFHSNVAFFHWLTGVSVLRSVIIVGQILNALAPLMIYPLVRRLGGSAWAGLIAVLIASLLSPMPAGYVNWGRYTQLTGMVALPVAAALMIDALVNPTWGWRRPALASVALAGLFLSHYLVTLLFAPFALAFLVWRSRAHTQALLRAVTIALMAGLLLLPWILNLWHGMLPRVLAGRFASGAQPGYFQTAYNAVGDLFLHVPAWLIALAAVGALWGCWQRRPLAIVTSLWTGLLVLVANPHLLRLPGTGVVNNFTLVIALYLPLSVLAGAVLAHLVERATLSWGFPAHNGLISESNHTGSWDLTARNVSISEDHHTARSREVRPRDRWSQVQVVVAGLILLAALAGTRLRLMDLDYRYRLVTPADLEAMQWIRDNTPADARFLVDALTAFGGYTVVGNDAGWWIPYLAGRRNTVPPTTYGLEIPRDADYPAQVRAFYREISTQPLDSEVAVQSLRAHGVTHVYIGAVGGELLDPAVLARSPFYRLVYERKGVMIFEVRGAP